MSPWRAAALGLSLMAVWPASAAVFTVNSTVDAVDVTPGDGVCASAGGVCTLRAAVMETNALPGADVVEIPVGHYVLTIPGANEGAAATGDLDVLDELTLQGSGAAATILDAAEIDRVLDVRPVVFLGLVRVNGVSITGGYAGLGGGVASFGAHLSLADTTISGNRSSSDGGGVAVGFGSLEARDVVITANRAPSGSGGGVRMENASGTIASSSIAENEAYAVGGVSVLVGELTLSDSSVLRNVAQFGAAGLAAASQGGILFAGPSRLTIERSVIARNAGDGIVFAGVGGRPSFPSVLVMTNTTVSGNAGTGVRSSGNADHADLRYSTVSANGGGGLSGAFSPGLTGTIVADQTAGADCAFAVASDGHNLDSDGSCGLTQPTDLPNTAALLGPLQNYGGSTETHALLPGSPAIDAIPLVDCTWDDDGDPGTPDVPLRTDQRGIGRPVGSACDIGAFEAVVASCGLGPDLAVLLPAFLWLRERRRRRAA